MKVATPTLRRTLTLYPPQGGNDPLSSQLAGYVALYQRSGDLGQLLDQLRAFAERTDPDFIAAAAKPFQGMPEVIIPLYERVTAERPADAQAMVILANAYWLAGRGPDAVSRLVTRAKEIDPSNRGAWHLWALAESSVRKRVDRWLEVTKRFPTDQLARAALADNATSLAGAEHDPDALDLAVSTYESLWAEASRHEERRALEETITKLKGWML